MDQQERKEDKKLMMMMIRNQISMDVYDPWIVKDEVLKHENWTSSACLLGSASAKGIVHDKCALLPNMDEDDTNESAEKNDRKIIDPFYINETSIPRTIDHSFLIGDRWSVKSLRQDQNDAFVSDTIRKGVAFAKTGDVVNAEACYKSILEVKPDYAECLVAYGALCANQKGSRDDEAISMFEKALDIDHDCPNARVYLNKVLGRRNKEGSNNNSLVVSETTLSNNKPQPMTQIKQSAINDILTEQTILNGHGLLHAMDSEHEQCHGLHSEYTKHSRSRSHKKSKRKRNDDHRKPREKKHHHSKHHRKRKKRRRYSCSSSSSPSSDS